MTKITETIGMEESFNHLSILAYLSIMEYIKIS